MKIAVQLFGPLAEKAGRSTIEVTTSGNTVADVVAALSFKLDRSVRYAVNTDYAEASAIVREGDTVSLIPPVGGG
jgi:molybdopterin converting factor small subunit